MLLGVHLLRGRFTGFSITFGYALIAYSYLEKANIRQVAYESLQAFL